MIELKTREHLVYFMQAGLLRLSKYDLRFVQNLQVLIHTKNNITTNQVSLFERLVAKYQRQLEKHNINQNIIDSLHWSTKIVSSDPKFTEAYISIDDDIISFRGPFNKKFVDTFRKIPNNDFVWVKEKKAYQAPFTTLALKIIVDASHLQYPIVNYCPVTQKLLNNLIEQYEHVKYWSPTLVKCNEQYLIAALNPELADAIKDITLSNDPTCLSTLATYGVLIDIDIIVDDPVLKFASTYMPEVDIKYIDTFVENLKAIECDGVCLVGRMGLLPQQTKSLLISKMKDANIKCDERHELLTYARAFDYKNPVVITSMNKFISVPFTSFTKVVRIKNSMPIDIK